MSIFNPTNLRKRARLGFRVGRKGSITRSIGQAAPAVARVVACENGELLGRRLPWLPLQVIEFMAGLKTGIHDEAYVFKRERILAVAETIFYEKGYNGTLLEDIANALEATKPFIYYHFSSKTELLDEVCLRATAFGLKVIQDAVRRHRSPTDQFRQTIYDLAIGSTRHYRAIGIYFREEKYLSAAATARLRKHRRKYDQLMTSILERGRDSADFEIEDCRVATQALNGMVTWSFAWYRPKGPYTPEQLADQIVLLAFNLVGARRSASVRLAPRPS